MSTVHAGFATISGHANSGQWFNAVGSYTSILFNEFPHGTEITNQYAPLGAHFQSALQMWITYTPLQGSQDNMCFYSYTTMELTFDTPMHAFAMYFGSWPRAEFYSGDQLLHTWDQFVVPTPRFVGFTSDAGFDRIVFRSNNDAPWQPPGHIRIDDLYFSTVPGPAAVWALALSGRLVRRRRGV